MAAIRKLRSKWQAQVRIKGHKPQAKSFTLRSDAVAWAGHWHHAHIQLSPNSDDDRFLPIELSGDEAYRYRVVGEFVCVLDQ
ncbi:MAG: hypothetical protein AB7S90_13405 [Marinobacterium sp.]